MVYSWYISTPANTTESQPVRTRLQVTKGLVYRVEIEFPPGPLSLCHVSIFDGAYQVWPSNPGESFHGDNGMIGFDDTYLKAAEPFELVAETWNEDDTYEHAIWVRLGMASEEVFMARYLPTVSYEKMLETFRLMQAEQEAQRQGLLAAPLPWKQTEESE